MKVYQANWTAILTRYYLMMAIVLVSLFMGIPFLALLAVPVFLSALMGFKMDDGEKKRQTKSKVIKVRSKEHTTAA